MLQFADAAVARAAAVWPQGRVYALGDVPELPGTPYVVLSVTSGAPGNYRLNVEHGSKGYRIVVQAVGKTLHEVAFAVDKVDAAFEDQRLVVAGFDTTPAAGDERVSSPVIRDADAGGLLTCTVLYPFTAYPEE